MGIFWTVLLALRRPWFTVSTKIGLFWHLQVGTPNIKFVGFALLLISTALALVTLRLGGWFQYGVLIDLASLIFFGLYIANWRCQLIDEDEDSDAVSLEVWFHMHSILDWFAFGVYCSWGYSFISEALDLALVRSNENVLVLIYVVIALVATDLLIMTVSGGKKGKLWENVKNALKAKQPQFVTNSV